MEKHARNLYILERLVSEKKQTDRMFRLFGSSAVMIFGGCFAYSFGSGSDYKFLTPLGLIGAAAAAVLIYVKFSQSDKLIEKMKETVGAIDDEAMEDILEASRRITNNVFMSDRFIMDFESWKAVHVSDIALVKPYTSSGESGTVYGVQLKLSSGGSHYITFPGPASRDDGYKLLSTDIGLLQSQKYID